MAVAAGAGSTPAFASEGTYVPSTPEPGLGGLVVQSSCIHEAPSIEYSIDRMDGAATARTASAQRVASPELVLSGGGRQIVVPLPTDAAGSGSGSVLWPGVVVSGDGAVTALPGWKRVGDQWEPRDDAAAWTTGDITAQLRVGDEMRSVPVTYPGYVDGCATPAGVASTGTGGGSLAYTGGQLPIAAALGGAAAVVAGTFLVARRRRPVRG
ncbi:LPXTG cell wall anchor domain-containing protein [Microbacterium sp. NPDC091382]|uniref:LPXTG cell wall anchor domain-containing protein n=1 Tax=Microbacterium sp. NPDC091382 TaxID=3364210 RepID=UPI00380B33F2